MSKYHPLPTVFGTFSVLVNDSKHLFVTTGDMTREYHHAFLPCIVNGVEYRCDGHLELRGDEWVWQGLYAYKMHSNKFNDYSDSARSKLGKAFREAAMAFVKANPELMKQGQLDANEQQRERIRSKIAEHQKDIAALEAELAAIV